MILSADSRYEIMRVLFLLDVALAYLHLVNSPESLCRDS